MKIQSDHGAAVIAQVGSLRTALEAFQVDCSRYPSTGEGLAALIARPQQLSEGTWRGPYLQTDTIPRDSWGRDFVYVCPGRHNTNGFDLYSLGPDGVSKSGGEDPDDVPSWSKKGASQ